MKFKKVLIMLLLLFNAQPVFSYGASASGNIEYNGMTFRHQRLRPDELMLEKYTGNDENLVIPESIDNYIVTAIDKEVFKDNQNIKNVTLPDCLNYLGQEVFSNSSLVSVNIPESLQIIPTDSFNKCSKLETVTFHDDILAISNTAFSGTHIEIPPELYDAVTNEYIYSSDSRVSFSSDEWGYTICNSYGEADVTIECYLGNDTEIIIPDSIRSVNVNKVSIGFVRSLSSSVKSIYFPETMTELDVTFRNPSLEEVTLPPVDHISNNTFQDCTNLKKVNFQSSPETFTIGAKAFANCTSLDFIPYPENCKNINIGKKAFENTDVKEVRINFDSTIGEDAFRDCEELSYVELNNTNVNQRAFTNCSALEDITVTGKSVLEEMSFYNCELLKNITLSDDIQVTNPVYNCPELMTINNRNVFDSTTGDFSKDFKDFICNNFSGVDDVGFMNLYVKAQAEKIVKEITSDNMSDVQKIRAVHDWICKNTVYDDGQSYDRKNHNDASVFMNDSTVCEGYARISNILYNTAGIETYYISGVDHAWNVVREGNNYFHIDTTWDDGDQISYDWFMKSDEEMRESGGNHAKWVAEIPSSLHNFQQGKTLPECSYSMGDVNQDNKLNIADMVVMNRYILCQNNINYDNYILSDLTFDGVVDSFDLVKMRQLLIKSNISDAVIMQNYILSGTYIDYVNAPADLTGDGVIDVFDLVLLKKQLIDSGC